MTPAPVSNRRRVNRNPRRPSDQKALDDYASTYCMSLLGVASEGTVDSKVRDRLDRQWKRAKSVGVSDRRLRGVEKWCEREMGPRIKKLYGVDVRKQGELFG
jgi:hypothetical protein